MRHPRVFVAIAVAASAAFLAAHALGLRGHVSFLSGTESSVSLGLAYLVLYFGFVLAAPVLAIAALAYVVLERATRPSGEEVSRS